MGDALNSYQPIPSEWGQTGLKGMSTPCIVGTDLYATTLNAFHFDPLSSAINSGNLVKLTEGGGMTCMCYFKPEAGSSAWAYAGPSYDSANGYIYGVATGENDDANVETDNGILYRYTPGTSTMDVLYTFG